MCVGLGVDVCVWLGVCTRVWHLYMICNVCTCVYGIQRSKPFFVAVMMCVCASVCVCVCVWLIEYSAYNSMTDTPILSV